MRRKTLLTIALPSALAVLVAIGLGVFLLLRGGDSDLVDEFARETGLARLSSAEVKVRVVRPVQFAHGADFLSWQRSVRQHLMELFPRSTAAAAVPEVQDRMTLKAPPGLVRIRLRFVAADGVSIPAILQYPHGAQSLPGILVLPGHVPDGDSGLRQLVTGNDSYQRAAATALAQRGFVTLAFELRGFGLLAERNGNDHNSVAYNALLRGTFYKAVVIEDAHRALALLRSLPVVDNSRIGVTGASLGGELAILLGVLDTRIGAIAVSSAGGESGLLDPIGVPDTTSIHYCHIIPGAGNFLRKEHLTMLLAPRDTLLVASSTAYKRDDAFLAETAAAWRAAGAPGRFRMQLVAGEEHDFFPHQTIEFFSRTLAVRHE